MAAAADIPADAGGAGIAGRNAGAAGTPAGTADVATRTGDVATRTGDVVVAGGGVIGSAIAWRAAAAGLDVTVVDPDCGDAASLVAAGMLAPVSEAVFGEDSLLALNLLAASRFPSFAAELEQVTGEQIGLRREGTLAVAHDSDDHAALLRLTAFRRSAGLDTSELDSRQCRRLEPYLAPGVRGGATFPGDWSVSTRRYAAALRQAMAAAGARTVRGRVTGIEVCDGAVRGVRLAGTGAAIGCASVVVAAGWRCGEVEGLPDGLRAAVRPVKGQLLRLRHPGPMPPILTRTVRATVAGTDIYIVPRADGEVIVGATVEERGPDQTVTAGAVHDLLHDAMCVLPAVSELILAETCAGLRPATPDNGPILGPAGPAGPAGLLVATGHYRNGILQSPVTADAALAYLTGQRPAPEWEPFRPQRFAGQAVPR